MYVYIYTLSLAELSTRCSPSSLKTYIIYYMYMYMYVYVHIIYVCLYIYLELGRVVNKMLALEKGRPGLLSLKEVRMVGTLAQLRIHINIHVRQHISMYYYIYVDMFWHICIAERNTNMESSKKKKEGGRGGKKLSYCACPL